MIKHVSSPKPGYDVVLAVVQSWRSSTRGAYGEKTKGTFEKRPHLFVFLGSQAPQKPGLLIKGSSFLIFFTLLPR